MSATIIAILGLLWTLFQSLLLFFQIWAFFDGLFMRGERVETLTLLRFGSNGITIAILGVLLLPYLKPLIMLGIRALCAIFKLQFVPVDAIDQGLTVASDLVRGATGAAMTVGKQVVGTAAKTVEQSAAQLAPTVPAGPFHVVIDNLPQLLAAAVAATPPAKAVTPPSPDSAGSPQTTTAGAK